MDKVNKYNMTSLFEAIVGDGVSPRHFWLVIDIPTRIASFPDEAARAEKRLTDIANLELHGVRGISDSKEILTGWWMVARNAAIMLDAQKTIALNDVEQIQYDNPEQLCADNMRIMYRLFDKEGTRPNHDGLMMNVAQYIEGGLNEEDSRIGYMVNYCGFRNTAASLWNEAPSGINNVRDLMAFIRRALIKMEEKTYAMQGVAEKIDDDMLYRATLTGLRKIGNLYRDEGEWIVASPSFRIPPRSIMLVGVDKQVESLYDEWKQDPNKDAVRWMSLSWRLESYDCLITNIKTYNLDKVYDLRTIDSRKFETIRGDIMQRRREVRNRS